MSATSSLQLKIVLEKREHVRVILTLRHNRSLEVGVVSKRTTKVKVSLRARAILYCTIFLSEYQKRLDIYVFINTYRRKSCLLAL